MESDSSSLFPLKQDHDQDQDVPIICPDFSIWDLGIQPFFSPDRKMDNTLLLQGNPQQINEGNSVNQDKVQKKIFHGEIEPFFNPNCTMDNTLLQENPGQINQGSSINQDEVQKKIVHREIEKQRRREMATLYASLRAVVPPNYIKGKRALSDQIHSATKYITFLQNNIKKLETQRDSRKRSGEEAVESEKERSSQRNLSIAVKVQPCSIGIEVLISGDFATEGLTLPLSKILKLLLEEGLSVVDCNCTKFDGRLHYMIQSEVLTHPSTNLQVLQKKLISMIHTLEDIKQ